MNQDKSTESSNLLHTQTNVSAHFLYNTGTLNFSRYIENDLTQLEYNGSEKYPSTAGKTPNKDNATVNNDDLVSFTTDGSDPIPKVATGTETLPVASTNANDTPGPTNDNGLSSTTKVNGISGFRKANGDAITRTNKPLCRSPKVISTVITPQQKELHAKTVKQRYGIDTMVDSQAPRIFNTYDLKLKDPKIFHSSLLDKKYKPNLDDIDLSPELEPLKPLIASQHTVFLQPIKDLGQISITLTKLIEKKADSLHQLKHNNKIPRSLRIKCALTTSPAFMDNEDFLRLKENLNDEVSLFIKKGTNIMTEWATINIQLLKMDRCYSILTKALLILDGLITYNTEVIGMPSWPSVPLKYTALFLLKLYFSNKLLDVSDLISFLDLTSELIIITGAKIMLKTSSNDEATKLLDTLLLSDIDMNDELHNIIIRETLLNFDQTIRFTTVYLWLQHKEKERQATASLNLTSKITSIESTNASELTAMAIAKASNKITNDDSLNINANLRLNNLEKAVRRQEQQSNEIRNFNKRNKTQKNSVGSHPLEQLASPNRSAPPPSKTVIVDLTRTNDKSERESTHGYKGKRHNPATQIKNIKNIKRQRKSHHTPDPLRRRVQWKTSEMKNFNPNAPVASTLQPQDFQANSTNVSQTSGSFQPYQFVMPQPISLGTPVYNTLHNGTYSHNQHLQKPVHQPTQFIQGHVQNPYYTQQPHFQSPFHTPSHPLNNPFISQHQNKK
jgi:hypothetical protein